MVLHNEWVAHGDMTCIRNGITQWVGVADGDMSFGMALDNEWVVSGDMTCVQNDITQ